MGAAYLRVEPVDLLVRDDESIVVYESRFVRLGPLATFIVVNAETPQTADELTARLTDAFGAPAEGSASDATRRMLVDLVAQGVLQEVRLH